MTKSTTSGQQNEQSGKPGLASEADTKASNGGNLNKSSEDAKSRVKAGSDEGAGGGAKQKQQH